jgi:predicted ATP-grasp superfamily ATP-dependent carboligase
MRSRRPGALILGSDFRALAAVRALGRRGIPSFVVDGEPRSSWLSRYTVSRERWNGAMYGGEFRSYLLDLAQRRNLEGWVLFALQDETVATVAQDAAVLSRWYRLTTPGWEAARLALDKRLTNQLAEAAGVPHPQTWYPADEHELGLLDLTYPVLVKPTLSIWLQQALRRKALWAHDGASLRDAYRTLIQLVPASEILIQEAIPGDGMTQLSAAVFCRDGEVLGAMTARRRRQYPLDLGLSSCYVEAMPMPWLIDTAVLLVRHLGLSGVAELEFKHDLRQGVDKLLDINVRLWGWHGLCAACGLDFAHLLYLQATGQDPEPGSPVYGARWRRLVMDVPAALKEMQTGVSRPAAYVRSFFGTHTVGSVLAIDDPLPAVADAGITAWRVAGHALRRRIEARSHRGGRESQT